jgi:lysophospholipase L1-like esterase
MEIMALAMRVPRMLSTGVRTAFPLGGLLCAGLLVTCAGFGQTATVWVRPGHYKELKPDRLKSIVAQMVARDVDNPPSSEGVMFAGSSTIADWDLKSYFPQYRTVNRGIGDSLTSDMSTWADQLIIPFKPSTIVFYSGDNDIAYGMTPDVVAAEFSRFVKKIHDASPKTELVVLSIRPTIARLAVWNTEQLANEKIKAILENDKQVQFVDVTELLTLPDGQPSSEMLAPDLQHLNKQGYDLLSPSVRNPIKQAEALYWRGFVPPRGQ